MILPIVAAHLWYEPPRAVLSPRVYGDFNSIAFDGNNDPHHIYAGGDASRKIFRIHLVTQEATVYQDAPEGQVTSLAFGADGTLYWTSALSGRIWAKHRGQARPELLGGDISGLHAVGIRVDNSGRERVFVSQVGEIDTLLEFYPGRSVPRVVAKDLGGLTSFQFGSDGKLYGTLSKKGQVISLDVDKPDSVQVISEGYLYPNSIVVTRQQKIFVLDGAEGAVIGIDLLTKREGLIYRDEKPISGLVLDNNGRLYFAVPSQQAIYQLAQTGATSLLKKGDELALPGGLAFLDDHTGRRKIVVADGYGVKLVETVEGAKGTVLCCASTAFLDAKIGDAAGVAVSRYHHHIVTTGWRSGTVQVFDVRSHTLLQEATGLNAPYGLVELEDNVWIVADFGASSLVKLTLEKDHVLEVLPGPKGFGYEEVLHPNLTPEEKNERYRLYKTQRDRALHKKYRKVRKLVKETIKMKQPQTPLQGPMGVLAEPGSTRTVLITENLGGCLSRVDLITGVRTYLVCGLNKPEGLAWAPRGEIVIVEAGTRQLIAVNPNKPGEKRSLANSLPVGLTALSPNVPAPYVFNDITISHNTIFITSDVEGSLYELEPDWRSKHDEL